MAKIRKKKGEVCKTHMSVTDDRLSYKKRLRNFKKLLYPMTSGSLMKKECRPDKDPQH